MPNSLGCRIPYDIGTNKGFDNDEEGKVINYAAGYTLCELRRKIEKSSHPLKEELVCAIMELVLDDEDCEDSLSEWVNIMDRGARTLAHQE